MLLRKTTWFWKNGLEAISFYSRKITGGKKLDKMQKQLT